MSSPCGRRLHAWPLRSAGDFCIHTEKWSVLEEAIFVIPFLTNEHSLVPWVSVLCLSMCVFSLPCKSSSKITSKAQSHLVVAERITQVTGKWSSHFDSQPLEPPWIGFPCLRGGFGPIRICVEITDIALGTKEFILVVLFGVCHNLEVHANSTLTITQH